MSFIITQLPNGESTVQDAANARTALDIYCHQTSAPDGRYSVLDRSTGRSRVYEVRASIHYSLTPVSLKVREAADEETLEATTND